MSEDARFLMNESYGFRFGSDLIQEICDVGELKRYHPGDEIMDIGQRIEFMPLLIDGAVKVMREDESGDELLLYFLEKGDTCAMTMTCCMGNSKSEIRATAEKETQLIMIPVGKMTEWIQKFDEWRGFVFDSYNSRLSEMLESIDSLAFMNMHERVYKYLKDKVMVNKDTMLNVTHQEIANDLHTSRVVISRILKSLEKDGKIALNRNKLEVLDF